jgi:hypothetical protein
MYPIGFTTALIKECQYLALTPYFDLPAFLELESAIKTHPHKHERDCPERDEELGNRGGLAKQNQ